MVSAMNNQPVAKGFKFSSFLKTFDIKSSHSREKPYYHFVLKMYLAASKTAEWKDLPSVLLPETLIQEIKNLVTPDRLLA
jgi:hypothetical protein